jgi:arsenate reductase
VVLDALAELGIDASDHVPQRLEAPLIAWADVIVATCDDACPVVPGKRYVQWQLADPKGRPIDEVRAIRDEVAARVDALLAELGDAEGEQVGHLGD